VRKARGARSSFVVTSTLLILNELLLEELAIIAHHRITTGGTATAHQASSNY
jgi:hypothetical protein